MVFGEPAPVRLEPPTQPPFNAKHPAVILNPLAAVVEPVLLMANKVVVALAAVVEEIKKIFALESVLLAEMASLAPGVEVPTPTFPLESKAKTLCEACPKNSAILPTPLCRTLKKVLVVEVAFCTSERRNCPGVMFCKVWAERELLDVPAVVA